MTPFARWGTVVGLGLLLAGCATTQVNYTRWGAAPVNLGTAHRVAVVVHDFPRPSAAGAIDTAANLLFGEGLNLQPEEAVERLRAELPRRAPTRLVELAPPEQAEVVIDVYPLDWRLKGEHGESVSILELDATFSSRMPGGRARPLRRTYRAVYRAGGGLDLTRIPMLIAGAADEAVGLLWRDVSPSQIREHLQLDTDAGEVKPAVKLVRRNDFDGAIQLLLQVVRDHQDSAAAVYDLGVLYEARGDPEGARNLYQRALQLRPDYVYANDALGRLDQIAREQQASQRPF